MTYKPKKENIFFLKRNLAINICRKFSKFEHIIPSKEVNIIFLEKNAIAFVYILYII